MELRGYQEEMLAVARAHLKAGKRSVCIQAPTGSGKTVMVAKMIGTAVQRGRKCWFIVHRRELINQSSQTLSACGIRHGIISSGWLPDQLAPVQVASIQTVTRRLGSMVRPDLMVWDECHHTAARSWARVKESSPGAIHVGLTATPERLDGRGLDSWFDSLVLGPSTSELITQGWLAPFRIYAPTRPNLDGVHKRGGDYAIEEVAAIVDRPRVIGDAVTHYLRLLRGLRAVAFACTISHSKHLAQSFLAAGVPAEHVDGHTDVDARDSAVDRFKSGKTLVLCNVDLFGEGFDLPAMEGAILCRPTQSLSMYLQQCGRTLRPMEGKEMAVIVDHAGNCYRHGFPDDDRPWSLQGREKGKKAKAEVSVRLCPKCFGAMKPGVSRCIYCGYAFERESPDMIPKHGAGDLEEIKASRRENIREIGKCRTFEELVALGKSRGYRYPESWAKHVMQAREKFRARRPVYHA